jgi:hypothetical protein
MSIYSRNLNSVIPLYSINPNRFTTSHQAVSGNFPYTHFTILVNETNRHTEFQFYLHYNSTCFGQPFCPPSGVLSRKSALVYFCRFCDRLLPGVGWKCSSILLLVANGQHICIKCTTPDVQLRTPDDGQKGCPKHIES